MGVIILTSTEYSKINATLTIYRTLITPISQLGTDAILSLVTQLYNLNCTSYMAKYNIEKIEMEMPFDLFCGHLDLWHLSKALNCLKDNIEIGTINESGILLTLKETQAYNKLKEIIACVNQKIIETLPEYQNATPSEKVNLVSQK